MGGFTIRPIMRPLAWADFNEWAIRHELTGEGFDLFWAFLRKLDAEYLSYEAEKAKSG